MFIEIPKGTSEKKIRKILKIFTKKKSTAKAESFFGKLPDIEDGLIFQKKLRKS